MNIRDAKLRGIRAAAEAHDELGILDLIRSGLEQVDVYEAINLLGIPVVCRPLEGLLGVYISSPNPGIIVTTNRRPAIQRFTAAHELGHFWLKHSNSFDGEEAFSQARQGVANVPLQEVEAEAFASEFILPKLLLFKTMIRQGWSKSDLRKPDIVYQLSLRVGVSYEATCRSLLECNYINQVTATQLLVIPPKNSKLNILSDLPPVNAWADAFRVTSADNLTQIIACEDDTVMLELPEHSSSGFRWSSIPVTENLKVIADVISVDPLRLIGGISTRKIYLRGKSRVHIQLKERREWEISGEPLKTFELNINFNEKEIGIPRSVRV